MDVNIQTYIYVCLKIFISVNIHICMSVDMYICMIHIYRYIHVCINTNIHIEVYQVHLPLPPLLGLFCHMVGLFCHIVGLFCHIVGLFCHIVGLFCHSKYTRSIFPGSDLRDSAAPPTTTATARPEPPERMFLNVSLEASSKPSMR